MIFINARFLTQKLTGVQRFAIEISLRLKEFDPSIQFLSPPNILHTELAEKLQVQVIGRSSGYYWEQVELPLFLKKNGSPRLLSLANVAPVFYTNNLLVIHDICILKCPAWYSRIFYFAYKILIPQLLKTSKRIFTVSEFCKQEIIDYLKFQGQIDVVYNAVDNQYTIENGNDFNPPNTNYILAVSSFSPRKNFEKIIEAFAEIEEDILLVIVGGTYANFPKSKFDIPDSKIDKIIFAGYINDISLQRLYKNAVCLVYPSLYEGFGIPPIEAMRVQCPVVVSDNTCFREICKDAAIYVNPYDKIEIKQAVLDIFQAKGKRESLIRQGDLVSKLYSWEQSAKRLLSLILDEGKAVMSVTDDK